MEARTVRMDGQAGMRRSLPAAERLRLHTSRKGMVREIVRRRAYRAVDVRAWAPQRSTASHLVQAGALGPISVRRRERTPRIGGAAIGRSPERAPLLVFVSAHCCAVLCCAATHGPCLCWEHDEDSVNAPHPASSGDTTGDVIVVELSQHDSSVHTVYMEKWRRPQRSSPSPSPLKQGYPHIKNSRWRN